VHFYRKGIFANKEICQRGLIYLNPLRA
jgi:hypothetical protein